MMLNLNEKPNLHEAALDLWYMSKEEIIENSPSKRDGISWKTEMHLRKSYCTFLRKLGKRLKMRQVYIATAIVLCHRFFLRQSLAKNDRWTIATVCLFLAGKIEDDPRPVREIILASYELIHENDLFAVQKIKRKEVYDQQKKQIILAEKIVLINLDFSIDVRLPYKPLIEALRKLGLSGHRLAQVAWNFVNDGLKTLLCLQFQPQQIAAGAIFLAAKFLNVNIPSDGAKTWWQDFDVSQIQLDEICNQTMRLYEKKQIPTENLEVQATETGKQNIDLIAEVDSYIIDPYMDHELGDIQNSEQLPREDNEQEKTDGSNAAGTEGVSPGEQDRIGRTNEVAENKSSDDSAANKSSCDVKQNLDLNEGLNSYSPSEVIKMISENELMAVLERMRKEQEEVALKIKEMDEDDLFIKELEAKLAIENVKHDSLDNDDETGDVKHAIAIADKAEEPQKVTDDALLAPNSRKRKAVRPPAGQPAAKRRLGSGDHNGFGE